jgi:hypothetical protein
LPIAILDKGMPGVPPLPRLPQVYDGFAMSDGAAVILYHHTNHRVLPVIRREGLTVGRMVVNEKRQVAAISLTLSPTPEGLGINLEEEPLTEVDRVNFYQLTGVLPPPGAKFGANGTVRITVSIPECDARLVHWRDYRQHVESEHLRAMEDGERPETW